MVGPLSIRRMACSIVLPRANARLRSGSRLCRYRLACLRTCVVGVMAALQRHHVVEWNGRPVRSVKKAFGSTAEGAGLPDVSAHTLRHTAATWLMQAGVDKWEAAGFLGMSVKILGRVYGHHHPRHPKQAALAIGYRKNRFITQSLPGANFAGDAEANPLKSWSEWQDSNLRPLRPERSALPG